MIGVFPPVEPIYIDTMYTKPYKIRRMRNLSVQLWFLWQWNMFTEKYDKVYQAANHEDVLGLFR
jgi:hypothetical protein